MLTKLPLKWCILELPCSHLALKICIHSIYQDLYHLQYKACKYHLIDGHLHHCLPHLFHHRCARDNMQTMGHSLPACCTPASSGASNPKGRISAAKHRLSINYLSPRPLPDNRENLPKISTENNSLATKRKLRLIHYIPQAFVKSLQRLPLCHSSLIPNYKRCSP